MWIIETVKLGVIYFIAICVFGFVSVELSNYTGIGIDYFLGFFAVVAFATISYKDRRQKRMNKENSK